MAMIPCNVEQLRYGPIVVTFPDSDKELFLQSDYDQASFAHGCGKISTDSPSDKDFVGLDFEEITECPEEYLDVAESAE
jgi:hypothetical protein